MLSFSSLAIDEQAARWLLGAPGGGLPRVPQPDRDVPVVHRGVRARREVEQVRAGRQLARSRRFPGIPGDRGAGRGCAESIRDPFVVSACLSAQQQCSLELILRW